MTTYVPPYVLEENPVKLNRTRPQHNVAKMLCEKYVHEHALTSRSPAVASLPSQISVAADFVAQIGIHIDPPAHNWNDLDGHIDKRKHLRENHNKVFQHILSNCQNLVDILSNFNIISNEEKNLYRESFVDVIELLLEDSATGYIEMPYWVAIYYDLLNKAHSYTGDQRLGSALDRFCLTLVYPPQDCTSYNLNLNYRYQMPQLGGNVAYYNVLAGYRLGRSKVHRGTNGDRPAIYLEEKMLITTLFSGFGTSLVDLTRTGLVSLIKPEKYG
ncbi:hypothetical protein [Deinococcus sp. PEB2-63]